jgi:predicted MPP superfamily phosphohydrolase
VIDLLRLINHFLPFLPEFVLANYAKFKLYLLIGVSSIVLITVLTGYLNARNPKITQLNLKIDKVVQGKKSLHMVFASDIHLGTVIRKERLQNIVKQINQLKPDIIVFGGDVVDEDIAPVIRQNLGEELLQLKAPLGVYTVTGNHEYIGGVEPAVRYLSEHGLQFLRDTAILIDGSFYLAGREDRDKARFTGKPRKEIHDILSGVDQNLPIIMIDHQPFHLDKVVAEGVDFQLSGHTHHGQLWPFGYVTSKIYELSHGYKKKENTHFYVSNGLGTWGPPVRTGNRPEIVDIFIEFK